MPFASRRRCSRRDRDESDHWTSIELLKDDTGNVALSAAMPAGNALVGALNIGAGLYRKGGIRVEASNSHSDFFVKNLVAIRAETRVALAVYRPAAFGDVNGASFGFRTLKDAWRKDGDSMVRELLDLEIAEISLTAFPAYAATDVAVAQRSMQAFHAASSAPSIHWLRLQGRT